jgi:hypothetical protein
MILPVSRLRQLNGNDAVWVGNLKADSRRKMNFDLGNILTRSGQITWKHKSIWALLMLPIIVAFLPLLLFLIFFLIIVTITGSDIPDFIYFGLALIFLLTIVVSTIINYAVRSVSNSAATLGIVRAERGEGSISFMDLLKDGLPYFWSILGVMAVVNLTIGLAFAIFFILVFMLIIVTIGMAAICLQPIMILLTPMLFLMVGVMEAAQIAVIVGNMNAMDAVKHAFQVVRANVWKYVIITLIVYFGGSFLSSIVFMPLMLPVFFVPFLLELGHGISTLGVVLISILFLCVFFPVMTLVSSVITVFMKTSLDLTYLQLTSSVENIENQV